MRKAIIERMTGLRDEARGVVGIRAVFDTNEIYDGPYQENAPDLIIGHEQEDILAAYDDLASLNVAGRRALRRSVSPWRQISWPRRSMPDAAMVCSWMPRLAARRMVAA